MKCPKCGFTSFDFLENCKKCGNDLQDHKSRFGLRSLIYPGLTPSAPSPGEPLDETAADLAAPADSTDFGFDFMSDESSQETPEATSKAVEEDDGFDFPADEPGEDALPDDLVVEDDNAFDFTADTEDETEGAEEIVASDTEDDLDFDNWDDIEETETKENKGAGEDPADPFDFRESAAAERIPEAPPTIEFATELNPEVGDGLAAGPSAFAQAESEPAPELETDDELFPLEEPPASLFEQFGLSPGVTPEPEPAAVEETAALAEEITWAAESFEAEETAIFAGADAGASVPLPSLANRIAATVVDLIVLAVVFLLFLVAGQLTVGDDSGFWLPSLTTVIEQAVPYFLVLFALCFGYFTLFHFLTGQTPGKMLCELRVESTNGTPLQFSQAFLRSIGGLFALLPCGLGYLSVLLNRQGRGWNDRFAGSRLVPLYDSENTEESESLLEA